MSGIVGVGLSRAWVSSSSACVTASSEGILVNEMVSGKNCGVVYLLLIRLGDVGC